MKILLVADREEPYIWDYFDRERFKDIELILSCGDLKAEYLSFLVTMINAPLLYVPGNHNADYLTHPPEGCISLDDDIVTHKGIRIAGFGGSFCYNGKPFQYTEEQMKKKGSGNWHQKSGGTKALTYLLPMHQHFTWETVMTCAIAAFKASTCCWINIRPNISSTGISI